MDTRPRLAVLDLTTFQTGDQILFCPKCPWQATQPQGMKPTCPDCGAHLHVIRNDKDLQVINKGPKKP